MKFICFTTFFSPEKKLTGITTDKRLTGIAISLKDFMGKKQIIRYTIIYLSLKKFIFFYSAFVLYDTETEDQDMAQNTLIMQK